MIASIAMWKQERILESIVRRVELRDLLQTVILFLYDNVPRICCSIIKYNGNFRIIERLCVVPPSVLASRHKILSNDNLINEKRFN